MRLLFLALYTASTAFLVSAFYDASDEVVELTAGNFQKNVLNDDAIWVVEFYAPW
jgi:protein disulfide-isomerase A6